MRILHVVGARPNFMKIAPVLAACRAHGGIESLLVHSGQHYDEQMSKLFFDELGIPKPDLDLEVGSASHAKQTALILERFEPVLLDWKPDRVVVVGDVNSTMACTVAAVKENIPVAHVEAGLRSFDRTMPEEINRVVTDALADMLFVTESSGVENLRREGVPDSRIHLVGNVMIDTLLAHLERAKSSTIVEHLDLTPSAYAVLTLHRPANVDRPDALAAILEPIRELSRSIPVIFPVHPRTRGKIDLSEGDPDEDIRLVEPLGYLDFVRLMSRARLMLTDSGGIQEETTILGVPCVTLRENTERPITVSHGTNRLAGTSSEGIRRSIQEVMSRPATAPEPPPLWDGKAAVRILDILVRESRGKRRTVV